MRQYAILAIFCTFICASVAFLKREDCEVCVKGIEDFKLTVPEASRNDQKVVEDLFRVYCKTAPPKIQRFCYYVGGSADSATGILPRFSEPFTNNYPAELICEKLSKLDSQICEIKFDKQYDLSNNNWKKERVVVLQKILSQWGESCDGCIEKSEFVKKIEELKPKYFKEEKKEEL